MWGVENNHNTSINDVWVRFKWKFKFLFENASTVFDINVLTGFRIHKQNTHSHNIGIISRTNYTANWKVDASFAPIYK